MKIPKEIYIYIYLQKKIQQIIDELNQYNNIIVEYQKVINLLDNTSNQFRTKNWIEINDQSSV